MKRSKATRTQRALLIGFLTITGLGAGVGVGVPRAYPKSTTPAASVLKRLLVSGLQLSADERTCAENAASKTAKSTVAGDSGFNAVDDSISSILRCVSQDHAVTFVAGSLDALGGGNSSVLSGAFNPNEPTQPPKDCLQKRLRIATWPEVSEAFRSYADALLDANPTELAILSSRVQPYVRVCATRKDSKGITPFPSLTIEELRVRWNASVVRHGVALSAVARWSTPAQVGLPRAGTASNDVSGSTPHVAILASNSWIDVAMTASEPTGTNVAGATGTNVAGATIVLEPPTASETVASEALFALADAFDGRDQALIVHQAINISGLLTADHAVDRRVRIGRTLYRVGVVQKPVRIFISAFPS
jgi:hypothetical protein